jgi:hypothetical protein
MPSPFPGMNPYLEQSDAWHDFHERFLPALADAINALVGARYIVKIDEHLYVREQATGKDRLVGRGDVWVADLGPGGTATAVATAVHTAAPTEVDLPSVDVTGQCFVEIWDDQQRRLVTVVELLSPSNKYAGPERDQYLGKRWDVLRSTAHFVELDFLRGGPRLPLRNHPACDYYVLVSRSERRMKAGFWPLTVRDPLPTIPIPLLAGDPDVLLDLQAVLHTVYDRAGYAKYVYRGSPEPALSAADAAWARQILRDHGILSGS